MPDIKMPQLGESVTEGTIGKWLKAVGDPVTKYEPIAEVITDKVTAEIPSDFDGLMGEILIAEGETVAVGTVVCRIDTEGEAAGDRQQRADRAPLQSTDTAVDELQHDRHEGNFVPAAGAARGRFSPAVLHLAEEHQVDLSDIRGTGENGRITRKDVRDYIRQRVERDSERPVVQLHPRGEASQTSGQTGKNDTELQVGAGADLQRSSSLKSGIGTGREFRRDEVTQPKPVDHSIDEAVEGDEIIQPSAIRKTIAKRMVESKHTAPHAWTMVEADVTPLVSFRNQAKREFKLHEGIDLTYLPFFIKAVVESIKRYPMMNASWVDDKIIVHRQIHISIAVATDDALVVPVIHNADRLSIAGLAHQVNELAAKARSNRLTMADVQNGTFTVNNTGAFGSILSQPILNAPQAAILSVESIVKRPVVLENDAIAIRSMVNLCLSLDHRVLDGWIAGQFLRSVRERLAAFDDKTAIY